METSSFSLSLFSEGEVCVAGVGWTELTSASVSARTAASLFRGILAGKMVLDARCRTGCPIPASYFEVAVQGVW